MCAKCFEKCYKLREWDVMTDRGKKWIGYDPVGYDMGRKVFIPRTIVYNTELFALTHTSLKALTFVMGKPDIGEMINDYP